jgi:predicted deacylase
MPDRTFQKADAEQVWIRDSDFPGPTVIILGGVHGDEHAGIAVVNQMKSGEFDVPLERGRLIIALGNLAAIEVNRRFTDGGTNLNREFVDVPDDMLFEAADLSSEARRARSLKPYLNESDAAFDLHGFRQKDGEPFIITEPRGFLAALAVSGAGAYYVSSGWGGESGIEQGGTDDFMERRGKIGLCYELAQLTDLNRGIPRGRNGVLRFLAHLELIDPIAIVNLPTDPRTPLFARASTAVLANEGFSWGPHFPYRSFQTLEPGEFIAQNGPSIENRIFAGPNQVIIFPSDKSTVKPGDEMFNLGTVIDNPLTTRLP